MKTIIHAKAIAIATGFSMVIAMCTGTASAEDFNPQPDPPGKAQKTDKGAHNPPGDKSGAADKATGIPPGFKGGAMGKATGIPPGFKSGKSSDTKVLLPAVHDANKTGSDKTIKLDTSKVGAVEATK